MLIDLFVKKSNNQHRSWVDASSNVLWERLPPLNRRLTCQRWGGGGGGGHYDKEVVVAQRVG